MRVRAGKNLRQMISIVCVCPFFPAMSMEAKMMRRWWWGRAEHTSISSELVKIVYLIAMASLVNNFLSYLDFGMRAKWSREREKKHSIKSSSSATTTTINDKNSVRVSTQAKEKNDDAFISCMRTFNITTET